MKNIFLIGGLISLTYLILKIVEMKIIEKEKKPLKLFFKDALIVYFSVLIGYFFIQQVGQLMSGGMQINVKSTPVFIDNPAF